MEEAAHESRPLFQTTGLIIAGSAAIAGFTAFGVLNDPGEIIRQDLRFGPMIAAGKILLPLFLTIFTITFLARVRKCKSCGKLMFWRRTND
ncbi:MAG: hypothetical protein HQL51_08600 [Magnetococcales bacterium]|nr:hypothetical protein [Magnetococcales bacterium]